MDVIQTVLDYPWIHTALGSALLVLLAWLGALLGRRLMVRGIHVLSERTQWRWDNALVKHGVFRRLARVVPMLVVAYGIVLVPGVPEWIEVLVSRLALALIALFLVLAINAALSAVEDVFQASPRGRERSIKGYVQLAKIFVFVMGAIIILASLINKNAFTLLAGLGAVSAVLLLIFKDTILSVVASLQLASNDMLRVGDWISMPSADTDGFVTDIALHTVKVQNWDKTVSTVPTWHLISKSYRNWRGMYESGARRIRRALDIDATSVRFLDDDELDHLRQFRLLDGYFERKRKEIEEWNDALGEQGKLAINQRRLSNLGSFRAYMQAYIDAHPHINHDMLCAVRQLDPGPTGIPLQIYAYTSVTDFVPHENVQSDIFDHLIAIAPEFALALFQQPTGADLRSGLGASTGPHAGGANPDAAAAATGHAHNAPSVASTLAPTTATRRIR